MGCGVFRVGISLLGNAHTGTRQLITFLISFLLAITCISVSRLMLSIRTLAAEISPSMDLDELLSTAELNRVRWRRGRHDRELIVEIDTMEGLELDEPEGLLDRPSGTPSVYMSTVGRYTNAELELIDDV